MSIIKDSIHYRLSDNLSNDINKQLKEVFDVGIKTVHLTEGLFASIQSDWRNSFDFVIENGNERGISIFLSNPDDFEECREKYPEAVIGARARNAADCKNLELLGVDFIELNVSAVPVDNLPHIMGSELIKELIPRKEKYGWMILYLTSPVFASGLTNQRNVSELAGETNIKGIIIDDRFDFNDSPVETIKTLRTFFT